MYKLCYVAKRNLKNQRDLRLLIRRLYNRELIFGYLGRLNVMTSVLKNGKGRQKREPENQMAGLKGLVLSWCCWLWRLRKGTWAKKGSRSLEFLCTLPPEWSTQTMHLVMLPPCFPVLLRIPLAWSKAAWGSPASQHLRLISIPRKISIETRGKYLDTFMAFQGNFKTDEITNKSGACSFYF